MNLQGPSNLDHSMILGFMIPWILLPHFCTHNETSVFLLQRRVETWLFGCHIAHLLVQEWRTPEASRYWPGAVYLECHSIRVSSWTVCWMKNNNSNNKIKYKHPSTRCFKSDRSAIPVTGIYSFEACLLSLVPVWFCSWFYALSIAKIVFW